jgi:elongation factor 1 alpha-like protein
LSLEDREQLQKSGIEVRKELGTLSDQVTEKEIQAALWQYYFDVTKSVTYIKGVHAPKKAKTTPQKVKADSKFDMAVKSAAASGELYSLNLLHPIMFLLCTTAILQRRLPTIPLSSKNWTDRSFVQGPFSTGSIPRGGANGYSFFNDMPWGQVPLHRIGAFTHVKMTPSGGLLGGAPKMSKLAALAAAKKKQAEERRQAEQQESTTETSTAISLLDRLVIKKDSPAGQDSASSRAPVSTGPKLAFRRKATVEKETDLVPDQSVKEVAPAKPKQNLRAPPSTFAQALLGSPEDVVSTGSTLDGASNEPPAKRRKSVIASFDLPYATSKIYTAADPFSKPSPDDVVLNAQSKATFRS